MYSPTTRLLTLLELLQSRGSVSGPDIAARLEVEVRSVRRYITMLRDMGIPVDSELGRYGSYSLRPGFRLPPLMFTDPEIQAIILGLLAVRQLGLAATPGVESAAAKIERVLPDELRVRMRAIQGVLTINMPTHEVIPGDVLSRFSIAAHQHWRLWIEYQGSRQEGTTQREIDVYGLVFHAGYWYSVSYCHLRQDLRSFRLDRVQSVRVLNTPFEPPSDFDALDYLLDSIARISGVWRIKILLKTSMEKARNYIPGDMAILEEVEGGVLMSLYSDGLDWLARFLMRVDIRFKVYEPRELRDRLRQLAQEIIQMVEED
jgi:predicted DNA-binding transcriptional regulator YafY